MRFDLSFAADICVRASDYVVDKALFFKDHYDGGYLFRDMVILMAERTTTPAGTAAWMIRYQFAGDRADGWKDAETVEDEGRLTFMIPIVQSSRPGIRGRLRVETQSWNDWH